MRIPRPRDSAGGETGGRVAKVVADADVKRAFERGRSACSMASRSSAELVAYLLSLKCERRRIDGTRNVPKVARRSAM